MRITGGRCAIIDPSIRAPATPDSITPLLALVRPFVSICLLRLRPQDLPASSLLLALAILIYVACTTIAHAALLSPMDALLGGIVDSVLLCGLTLSLLLLHRRWARAVQTLTAMAGAGAVMTLAAMPFLAWKVSVLRAGGPVGLEMVCVAAIVLWNLAVIAHVLRHALSTSYLGATLIAVIMYLLSSQILSAMLESRMTV